MFIDDTTVKKVKKKTFESIVYCLIMYRYVLTDQMRAKPHIITYVTL